VSVQLNKCFAHRAAAREDAVTAPYQAARPLPRATDYHTAIKRKARITLQSSAKHVDGRRLVESATPQTPHAAGTSKESITGTSTVVMPCRHRLDLLALSQIICRKKSLFKALLLASGSFPSSRSQCPSASRSNGSTSTSSIVIGIQLVLACRSNAASKGGLMAGDM
jgi:hypothetical protein